MRAKRWALSAMAGRSNVLRVVTLFASVTFLSLCCLGALLALPTPGTYESGQLAILLDGAAFAKHAQHMMAHWSASSAMQSLAGLFVAIDTLLFVPMYVLLLTGLRARASPILPARLRWLVRWRRWRWLLAGAVVSDLFENGLLLLASQGRVFSDALLAATRLKWGFLLAILLVIAGTGVARAPWSLPQRWRHSARSLLLTLRDSARYLWLYAIPLFMLFAGMGMLAGVPQSREIISDFGDAAGSPAARLTTLVVTSFMLVVWIAACGVALALISQVDPLEQRVGASPPVERGAAVLNRAHQLMLGAAALVVTNVVLMRMSSQSGAALSLFIVVGGIGLWVLTARACAFGFRLLGLPLHPQARPVAWSTAALLMLLYLLVITAWRFLPDPREAELREWGLYRKPDQVWRFNADLIDPGALSFLSIAALSLALFLAALLLMSSRRRWPSSASYARVVFVVGMLIWLYAAWSRLGTELLAVQVGTIVAASIVLWLLTHRVTGAEYETWRLRLFGQAAEVVAGPRWLSKWIRSGLPGLSNTLSGTVARGAAAIVLLFFLLPHSGHALVAQTGTLAVVFAALSIWGLLAAWLLVYLPMRHGLGNWTLAPVAWLAVVSLLPRVEETPDARDNPSMIAAANAAPAERGNAAAPTLHQHLTAWLQLQPPGAAPGAESPVFVVSAAGGGLRAAYWTAVLLAELDDRTCGQFGRHVLAASGVSGGSLGLALYAAQRRVWQAKRAPDRCETGRAAQMRQVLSGDFLAPIAAGLLFADGPMAFVPFVSPSRDRHDALASAIRERWEQAFKGDASAAGLLNRPMRQALPALFEATAGAVPDAAARAHPLLYLNATSVETGRRVIASNVMLGAVPADPLFHDEAVSRGTRLLSARTSLLDAALHSARFPVISSAGKVMACSIHGRGTGDGVCALDGQPYGLHVWGHLMDGGYFENSGLETLADVLEILQPPSRRAPPVFLIAISNEAGTRSLCPRASMPRSMGQADIKRLAERSVGTPFQEASPTWRDGDAVGGLPATLKTLLSVREARARLALERVVQRLGCASVLEWSLGEHLALSARDRDSKDAFGGRRDLNEPALGWLLSASSMRRMDEGVQRYAENFPFDQAACPVLPGPRARRLIGARGDSDVLCR